MTEDPLAPYGIDDLEEPKPIGLGAPLSEEDVFYARLSPAEIRGAALHYWRAFPAQHDQIESLYRQRVSQLCTAYSCTDEDALRELAQRHLSKWNSELPDIDSSRADPPLSDLLQFYLGTERLNFGAVLQQQLFGAPHRIADYSEAADILAIPIEEMPQRIPPVTVQFVAHGGARDVKITIRGEGEFAPPDLKDRALSRALQELTEYRARKPGNALSTEGRERVRRFTRLLWATRPKLAQTDHADIQLLDFFTVLAGSAAELVADAHLDSAKNTERTRWKRRPGRPPLYGNALENHLTYGGPPDSSLTSLQEESAWNSVLALDEDSLWTFMYVMFRWLAEGGNQKVRIHVNDLLAFRGREPNKGAFRADQKREQRDQLLKLLQHWMTVKDTVIEQRGKRRVKKPVMLTSPLIEYAMESVDDDAGLLPLPLGGEMPESLPYAFRVGIGEWARSYVASDRFYVMPLVKKIAAYDPKQGVQRMAFRFGIKLSFRWNSLAVNGRAKQSWVVDDLLKAANIEPPDTNAQRFIDTVEASWDKIADDGVTGGWDYGPEASAPLPERNKLAAWRRRTVSQYPPESVRVFYEHPQLQMPQL